MIYVKIKNIIFAYVLIYNYEIDKLQTNFF